MHWRTTQVFHCQLHETAALTFCSWLRNCEIWHYFPYFWIDMRLVLLFSASVQVKRKIWTSVSLRAARLSGALDTPARAKNHGQHNRTRTILWNNAHCHRYKIRCFPQRLPATRFHRRTVHSAGHFFFSGHVCDKHIFQCVIARWIRNDHHFRSWYGPGLRACHQKSCVSQCGTEKDEDKAYSGAVVTRKCCA